MPSAKSTHPTLFFIFLQSTIFCFVRERIPLGTLSTKNLVVACRCSSPQRATWVKTVWYSTIYISLLVFLVSSTVDIHDDVVANLVTGHLVVVKKSCFLRLSTNITVLPCPQAHPSDPGEKRRQPEKGGECVTRARIVWSLMLCALVLSHSSMSVPRIVPNPKLRC